MKEFEKAGLGICPECEKRIYFVLDEFGYSEMKCSNCGEELEIYDGEISDFNVCYYCCPRGDKTEKKVYLCAI